MKADKKNVYIPCFGDIRGCIVNHCDVARLCGEFTKVKEKANEK